MFDRYQNRLGFLSTTRFGTLVETFSTGLNQIFDSFGELAPALRESIELDMVYFCLRHFKWRHTAIFKQFGIQLLSDEYGLSQAVSTLLWDQALHLISAHCDDAQDLGREDNAFLRYIFCSILSTKDTKKIRNDLAISARFIGQVRDKVRQIISSKPAEKAAEFHSYIDQRLYDLLREYQSSKNETPWFIDLERLRFHLQSTGEQAGCFKIEKIFELLLCVGKEHRGLSRSRLEALFVQHCEGSQSSLDELIGLLTASQLIYDIGSGKHRLYYLTALGMDLTTFAYTVRFLRRRTSKLEELTDAPISYQRAVLQLFPEDRMDEFEKFLYGAGFCLPPDVWVTGIERLGKFRDHGAIFGRISSMIEQAPELAKKTYLQVYGFLNESVEARLALEKIISSATAWRIKDVASNIHAALTSPWRESARDVS